MSQHHVTIKDMKVWTTAVDAKDATHAEELAWELFHNAGNRAEHFEFESDTTVQIQEVIA